MVFILFLPNKQTGRFTKPLKMLLLGVRICLLSRDCRKDLIRVGSNISGRCIVGADHAELYLL